MKNSSLSKQPVAGFTIIEIIVTVAFLGLLSAIAIPSWLSFISQQRLNQAQDRVLTVLREAQAKAKRQETTWQACFRDTGTVVQSAIEIDCSKANWQPLTGSDSQFITIKPVSTTLSASNGYYVVQYQANGTLDPNAGTPVTAGQNITMALRSGASIPLRCVYVQTLLGTLHTDTDPNCK